MRESVKNGVELVDLLLLGFHALALVVWVVLWPRMPQAGGALLASSGMMVATVVNIFQVVPRSSKVACVVRVVLVVLSCPMLYERANDLVTVLHGTPSIEHYFVALDHRLFGGNPSEWTERIHHPVLTEWLQISYVLYFFLPLVVGFFLMLSGRWQLMPMLLFAVLCAAHVNAVFYVFVPVRSPFFIAELPETAHLVRYEGELAGLWLTDTLRQMLLDSTSMRYDCFPSGHTFLTVTTLGMAYRLHRTAFWVILPVGVSIVFSTIYLRYHYLVDLVVGLVFETLLIWLTPHFERHWVRVRARMGVRDKEEDTQRVSRA